MTVTIQQIEEELKEFLKEHGITVDIVEINTTFEIYASPEVEINVKGFMH